MGMEQIKKVLRVLCLGLPMILGAAASAQVETPSVMSRVHTVEDPELGDLIRLAMENRPTTSKDDVYDVFRQITQTYAQIKLLDLQIEQIAQKAGTTSGPVEMRYELLLAKAELESKRTTELAKKYNAKVIALTMTKSGIPVGADERIGIALESLIPRCQELDIPIEDLIIDPLVLTVSGCQEYCPELLEAIRTIPYAWDPPPAISVGLSNVSNAVPHANRPLINQVYCAMVMGAGLQMMIADPRDEDLKETIRIVEETDRGIGICIIIDPANIDIGKRFDFDIR